MPYFGSAPPENALEAGDIASNAVTTAKIADDAVDITKINLVSTSSVPSLEAKGDGSSDGYIQLNCSQNSHGIKLKSPPHSAGQSYTLTFPSSVTNDYFLKTDGSGNLSFAEAGGGKVLQVVSATKTDTATTASTSFSDISGLSVAITPAATSSKVLVTAVIYGGSSAGGVGAFVLAQVIGGTGTSLSRGAAASSRTQATGGFETQDNVDVRAVTINFLDSPSTTSEVTYKIQFACPSSNTLAVNRSNLDSNNSSNLRLASTITAMEIGA